MGLEIREGQISEGEHRSEVINGTEGDAEGEG